MIQLMGKQLDEIKIEFTGLRPGEKEFEEFELLEEITSDYSRIADSIHIENTFITELLNIVKFAQNTEDAHVKKMIFALIMKYEKAKPARKLFSVIDKVKNRANKTFMKPPLYQRII